MAEQFVYKIVDNQTGDYAGAYSRSYHTEYEFGSPLEARTSNVHDTFADKRRYRIQKWKVTYELVDEDCDPYKQVKIPYYKDYLKEKAFIDALNESANKVLENAFKQFHVAIGLGILGVPDNINEIIKKEEEKKSEEIEKMNREYKCMSLKELSKKMRQNSNQNESKLPRKLRAGWK